MKERLPLRPLEAGNFVPPFTLPDQSGKRREIQNYGGKYTVIFFLPPGDDDYLRAFFAAKQARGASFADVYSVYVLQSHSEALLELERRLGLKSLLWADSDGSVARAFGVEDAGAFVMTPGLRIASALDHPHPEALIVAVEQALKSQPQLPKLAFDGSLPHAPVTIIPNAISAELREELLELWRSGKQYQGAIGVGAEVRVSSGKRRVDVDIRDHGLLARVDEALSRTVFPELRRTACLDVRYRERYKIGRYTAEDKGYYNQHRDTGVPELTYRRYSMSLGLSDDYDGGILEFTEYGNCGYRLTAGTAILFPSVLLHQITEVTRGERFVMVSFMHGEAEEQVRKAAAEARGERYSAGDAPLLAEPGYPGVVESAALYTNSCRLTGS